MMISVGRYVVFFIGFWGIIFSATASFAEDGSDDVTLMGVLADRFDWGKDAQHEEAPAQVAPTKEILEALPVPVEELLADGIQSEDASEVDSAVSGKEAGLALEDLPDVASAEPGTASQDGLFDNLPSVGAGIRDIIAFHGFGGMAYGHTVGSDSNPYLTGTTDGHWENFSGGLAFSATPVDKLLIYGQFFAHHDEGHGGGGVELERLFAQYTVSDQLELRAGRLPHPIGIYSEVFEIGTFRTFFDLPQGVYGPTGISGESFDGAGITGNVAVGSWEFNYDLYAGQLSVTGETPFLLFDCEAIGAALMEDVCEEIEEEGEEELDDIVGGRLVLDTPIDGLSVGSSVYFQAGQGDDHVVWGFQGNYETDLVRLRSEYYHHDEGSELDVDTVYVEGIYRGFRHWGVGGPLENLEFVGRFEWAEVDIDGSSLPAGSPSRLTEHMEWALGLNYWVVPQQLVVRFSYHNVSGNLFAHDEHAIEDGETPDRGTDLVMIGVDFTF